jgi:Acetyltransferase (GNAT) domain
MQIYLNQLNKVKWDEFLRQQTHSHFWHSWEWGEFLASFKQRRILRYSIHEKGDIVGLCTVCIVPIPRFGRRGDSIPAWHFSGPILKHDLDLQAKKSAYSQLFKAIDGELMEKAILDMTFRIWDPSLDRACFESLMDSGYDFEETQSWMFNVREDESQIMKTYTKHFRNQVRQGERRGAAVEVNAPVDVEELYALHEMTMVHGHTRPRYSMDEVAFVLNWGTELKDLYLCKHEGRLMGFLVTLKFNNVTIVWLAGMDRRYAEFRPMNLMYHELMKRSARQAIRTVDIGGGVTEGVTHFKEDLGAKPMPIFVLHKKYRNNLYVMLATAWALGPTTTLRAVWKRGVRRNQHSRRDRQRV